MKRRNLARIRIRRCVTIRLRWRARLAVAACAIIIGPQSLLPWAYIFAGPSSHRFRLSNPAP